MTTLEHRLEGRQATARAIQAHVNRHLEAAGRLRRIEVRLSTAVAVPTQPDELRRLLSGLLAEHGLGRVELSLRRFERPLDNAGGEHLVRLMFDEAEPAPAPQPSWWQRLLRRRAAAAGQDTPRPGIPPRRAHEMLRQALDTAVRDGAAQLQGRPVAHIHISSRLPEIDLTLRDMMPPRSADAAQSVADMLRPLGVTCRSDLQLDYRFEPHPDPDATRTVLDADVRVHLSAQPATAPVAFSATAMPFPPQQATAMPDLAQLAALRGATQGLRVRVLGTMSEAFAKPFEMMIKGWPARLDRAALEAAGFGRQHGALLGVSSQNCPLVVERHEAGGLLLRPGQRADPALPAMYYGHDDLRPLPVELAVDELPMRLVLNCPAGVRDPASGAALPALRLELSVA